MLRILKKALDFLAAVTLEQGVPKRSGSILRRSIPRSAHPKVQTNTTNRITAGFMIP
jgi:hypothetical protein